MERYGNKTEGRSFCLKVLENPSLKIHTEVLKINYLKYNELKRKDSNMENLDKNELWANLIRVIKGSVTAIIITLILLFIF